MDAQQRIAELEEQARTLLSLDRELRQRVEELTPHKMFAATLSPNKALYWVEVSQR